MPRYMTADNFEEILIELPYDHQFIDKIVKLIESEKTKYYEEHHQQQLSSPKREKSTKTIKKNRNKQNLKK